MTDYTRRNFTYRPLVLGDHPELADPPHNLMLSMLPPASVAVLVVETGRIDTVLSSMAEFDTQYEPVSEE